MTTWQELMKYNFDSPPRCQFKRKVEIEDRYKAHIEHLKREDISIVDYIKSQAFPKNEASLILCASPPERVDELCPRVTYPKPTSCSG